MYIYAKVCFADINTADRATGLLVSKVGKKGDDGLASVEDFFASDCKEL